jgi:hypothetical protein
MRKRKAHTPWLIAGKEVPLCKRLGRELPAADTGFVEALVEGLYHHDIAFAILPRPPNS